MDVACSNKYTDYISSEPHDFLKVENASHCERNNAPPFQNHLEEVAVSKQITARARLDKRL